MFQHQSIGLIRLWQWGHIQGHIKGAHDLQVISIPQPHYFIDKDLRLHFDLRAVEIIGHLNVQNVNYGLHG